MQNKVAEDFRKISKREYIDKTTAGFLSQIVGFLSGFEFVTVSPKRFRVAMPDDWFQYLKGPYADPNPHKHHTDKHLYNEETGMWEVWFDDDFSVDIVNQHIISDMYRESGTIVKKYISDGWLKYNVWDMGGGQRQAGAYGAISRRRYLPQFAGNTEYENWYSWCTEAYLGSDTLGMNAAGMSETAAELTGAFAQVTGDRDNVLWAQMFSVMMSEAYFESDIPTLIREASRVFPRGSWPNVIVEDVFAVFEKHKNDWRAAFIEFEKKHYVEGDTRGTDTDINCGFVLLDLLFGGSDYLDTCRIGSLAGYDCESTCGIALSVLGIIGGMKVLPELTNTLVWQNGEGVLTNLVAPGTPDGCQMIAEGLPDRMKIADVVEKYRENFENILKENGGYFDEEYYYIPKKPLIDYSVIDIENGDFETGDLSGFTCEGDVSITTLATTGFYAAMLKDSSFIKTTVSGLVPGCKYCLASYIKTTENASAVLFAGGSYSSVNRAKSTPKYESQSSVRRMLIFTADAEKMEIGVIAKCDTDTDYVIADSLLVLTVCEELCGETRIQNKTNNNIYASDIDIAVDNHTDKEAYLKLRFKNRLEQKNDLDISLNGEFYAGASLYKCFDAGLLESCEYVYLPIFMKKGKNTLHLTLKYGEAEISDAQYVTFTAKSGQHPQASGRLPSQIIV